MTLPTKENRFPGVISPRFTNAANKPNPDGSLSSPNVLTMPHVQGGGTDVNSPVQSKSVSPGGSHTKSIMNASGSSGAVISNSPEPGLKRVATVTFSDARGGQPKAGSADPESETVAGKKNAVEYGEKSPSGTPAAQAGNAERHKPAKSSPLMSAAKQATAVRPHMSDTRSTPTIADSKKINSFISREMPGSKRVPMTPRKQSVDAIEKGSEEHPHFFVEDSLHTPSTRSRSNSTSPKPPVGFTNALFGEQDGAAGRPAEPPALEAVLEEPTGQKIAPNIPKRENAKNIDTRLPQDDGKLHILFGVTGSLAVFKVKLMIKKLEEIYGRDRVSIQVILTQSAEKFLSKRYTKKNKGLDGVQRIGSETSVDSRINSGTTPTSLSASLLHHSLENQHQKQDQEAHDNHDHSSHSIPQSSDRQAQRTPSSSNPTPATPTPALAAELPPHIQVWVDRDEWDVWEQRTDPVLHIELRRWADILVVAPLTANTLSKIALGLCDNLLTSVVRAWNPMFPIFLAPSMVSSTYNSTMTKKQLKLIKEDMPWITVFKPSEKVMGINGDIGLGGMMDGNEIVDKVVMKLGGYPQDEKEEEEEEDDDDDDDEDDSPDVKKNQKDDDQDEDDDDEDDDEDDDDEDEDDDDDDDDSNQQAAK